ncbi:archaetidylserine decarboxylase [Thiothrix subterranea]|uniref:Phosphatidylserine decarboxylase proenzyme n=1 Tax=Thiothrix subterranea TaxID=2735563 RepID=A0AA51MV63_9GAMM|nr:archaetidylserine decarboxylase [Thiothrix subterranea]MDQ5769886.1 archaetidylserine decarboxylase [Thiothrix subterranea]WML88951.1 archaetidylserine decarboxylase [Thiothrix subterranea]
MNLLDILKAWPLYILPHHFISRLVFRLTRIQCPTLVPPAIRLFSKVFKVNLAEALNPDPASYPTFNAFFTRSLQSALRPMAAGAQVMVSPVDGRISQMGKIEAGRIFQAKGHEYSAVELLGGDEVRAAPFMQGQFMTIYLSPRDYHRIHMPLTGTLTEQVYVPGRLFSVAGHTVRTIPRLFARNERVVTLFDTEFGKLAMVLVGAINVAAIETVWDGLVTPPQGWGVKRQTFPDVNLAKGAEMGRFNMGSTVILLLENPSLAWNQALGADVALQLGQALANLPAKD